MKKTPAAALLLVALALALAAQTTVEWITFRSPEGRFSVSLPTDPTPDTKTARDARVGSYTTQMFMSRAGGEVYILGWVDYDPKFNFDVQRELEANRDNLIAGIKGRLINSAPIKFGQHPGLEFTAETGGENPAAVKSRVYIIGRRPYQLIAVSPKGRDSARNFARFFSSFEMKPQQ